MVALAIGMSQALLLISSVGRLPAANGSTGRHVSLPELQGGLFRRGASFPLFWTLIGGAVKAADISQPGASHPVCFSFAICLLERGEGSRTIHELLRDDNQKTNMIYTLGLNRGPIGVRSPPDIP